MARDLTNWKGVPMPERKVMEGRYVRLEPLDATKHGDELYEISTDKELTKYMFDIVTTREAYQKWLEKKQVSQQHIHYVLIDKATGKVAGRQMFFEIKNSDGVLEIGGVLRGPLSFKKPSGTEAIYLFLSHVFDELGYRRCEWRSVTVNEPSKQAALRYGFIWEGVLRGHRIIHGVSRDAAVYSILDSEWPQLKAAYTNWLHPDNFDDNGMQKKRLNDFISEARS